MLAVGEDHLLRLAIGLCSRSAVASKAAYMLTLDQAAEQVLLKRCTDRYALLECLLGLLVERDTGAVQARSLLETLNLDPTCHPHAEAALAALEQADGRLSVMLSDALAERALPPRMEACFEDALAKLGPAAAVRVETVALVVAPANGSCGREAPPFID